jgi:hypothetical protein
MRELRGSDAATAMLRPRRGAPYLSRECRERYAVPKGVRLDQRKHHSGVRLRDEQRKGGRMPMHPESRRQKAGLDLCCTMVRLNAFAAMAASHRYMMASALLVT